VRFLVERDRAVRVLMLGKPTVDGAEACSGADQELQLTCDSVKMHHEWGGYHKVTGREESELIRGLIAELPLANPEVFSPAPEPPPTAKMTKPDPACMAQRKEIAARAKAQPDLGRRAEIYRTMPQCQSGTSPGPAAPVAPPRSKPVEKETDINGV